MWLFGYGSLVWRPAIDFERRSPAWVEGWSRRFWQGSTDHRGVPGAPGRVATLVRTPGERCWGMAYELSAAQWGESEPLLDHREQGGYERQEVEIHLASAGDTGEDRRVSGVFYVATPENGNYLGPAPAADIAAQVLASAGPSGGNSEYVLRLAAALREMGAHDPHLVELVAALTRLRATQATDAVPS